MKRPPIFVLLFLSIFGFIGITILVFLWTAKGFGAPPLIFKLFGSFIALAFICMGFGMPIAALRASKNGDDFEAHDDAAPTTPSAYRCPNCGAGAPDGGVSSCGDIKCEYCRTW